MKDRELKDKKVNIKRKIADIFLKLITESVDDMDKFEQKRNE